MQASYDMVVSLGGNCAAAAQFRMRGLRPFSLPFDWLYMESPKTIEWLAHGFTTGFSDFCLKENLAPISSSSQYAGGTAKYKYRDAVSGYGFIHHFHQDIKKPGVYEKVFQTLNRRLDRLKDALSSANATLFVLATDFCYELKTAEALRSAIESEFPNCRIDFSVLQFRAHLPDGRLSEHGILGENLSWSRHVRPVGCYDLELTSCEWAFLDAVCLKENTIRPLVGFEKLRYKLWKSLSSHFLNSGAALKGMNFRLFRDDGRSKK